MAYLQDAIIAIDMRLGEIVAISSVYQTPAWGFSSDDFYNACICVATTFSAVEALPIVLAIETDLGRQRGDTNAYIARTLDLDIILSSEGVIHTPRVQVPHPKMQDRKFVLVPLVEIAGALIHPILKTTIIEILASTQDNAAIDRLHKALVYPEKNI